MAAVPHNGEIAGLVMQSRIGNRQVVVTRDQQGDVHVLLNRCAHRGMRVCVGESGSGRRLTCPYHGWSYNLDGSLAGLPMPRGYRRNIDLDDPALAMTKAPRVERYRGFIFASLAAEGPSLADYLGDIADALDNMADRAPAGELEAAGGVLRQEFRGNWKLMMENTLDLLHPGFVHQSSVAAVRAHLDDGERADEAEQAIQMIAANGLPLDRWDDQNVYGFDNGHCYMEGFYKGGVIDPALDAPEFDAYRAAMQDAYGEARMREILARETFNNLIYPNVTLNTRYQFLRLIQPVAVDRTHVYSYCFRLKGAPDEMLPMSVRFVTTVSSPSSLIATDDLAVFERTHQALADGGSEWIDTSRRLGEERPHHDDGKTDIGISEIPMRTMLAAWRRYMTA
jgi:phenylpropionate dioxygenase-like ring-hydroxylating dioxygenase large terminal subunit